MNWNLLLRMAGPVIVGTYTIVFATYDARASNPYVAATIFLICAACVVCFIWAIEDLAK